jgi:hypothetical protein
MTKFPEYLTDEQSEALEKAALLIINARKEAAAMLMRSGVELPPGNGWFGSPCGAYFEGHIHCPCSDYTGDGGPCSTHISPDPAIPLTQFCGHRPSQHLRT